MLGLSIIHLFSRSEETGSFQESQHSKQTDFHIPENPIATSKGKRPELNGVFTLADTDTDAETDTDAIGFETHCVGVGTSVGKGKICVGVGQCEHTIMLI